MGGGQNTNSLLTSDVPGLPSRGLRGEERDEMCSGEGGR